jgi:hypothetical protein
MGIPVEKYQSMLARLEHNSLRDAKPSPGVEREKLLHQQIADECARRGWIVLHGSMAHRTHRTLGEPDFLILCHCGRLLLVEAKTRQGKLRPEQAGFHHWAAKLGHTVHVCRSLADFLCVADSL